MTVPLKDPFVFEEDVAQRDKGKNGLDELSELFLKGLVDIASIFMPF